jgi:hypothetical protein
VKHRENQPETEKSNPPYLPNGDILMEFFPPSELEHLKMGG